jgi:ribosome-associated toxin RatA of RatAB toxin-antitoxin module
MAWLEGAHARTVRAPLERCLAVLLDVTVYPAWFDTLDRVEVVERDRSGFATRIALVVEGAPRPIGEIRIDLQQRLAGGVLERVQVAGGPVRNLTDRWTLTERGGVSTEVLHEISGDLPRLLRPFAALFHSRAERTLVREFVEDFKQRVEAV